jgi:hypothetical protein
MSSYNDNDSIATYTFTIKDLKFSLQNNLISPTDKNIKKFLSKYQTKHLESPLNDFAWYSMDDILYDMLKLNILKRDL